MGEQTYAGSAGTGRLVALPSTLLTLGGDKVEMCSL